MAGHRKPNVLYLSPEATKAEISWAYAHAKPGDRIVVQTANKETVRPPPKQYECPVCFAKMRKLTKRRLPVLTWWGIREVCEALRVSPTTVYHNVRSGKWPATKVGRSWRFDVWAIRKMLKGGWAMKL